MHSRPTDKVLFQLYFDCKLGLFLMLHTLENIELLFKNWARVIREFFNWLFRYLKLILETWIQKLIQNTWSVESKIFQKNLEIQAIFKVRFLRRKAEMTWIKNFKALYTWNFLNKRVLEATVCNMVTVRTRL